MRAKKCLKMFPGGAVFELREAYAYT